MPDNPKAMIERLSAMLRNASKKLREKEMELLESGKHIKACETRIDTLEGPFSLSLFML
jgi:hypothetical protein